MTTTLREPGTLHPSDAATAEVARRLRPLRAAMFLEGIALWVPVEKLFMTQLGFDTTRIATMAAAYAAVVPLLEIPSGMLADRWSRRGVLLLAQLASLLSVLVAALSTTVPAYMISALLLGVYFALHSGTVDTVVYDLLVEQAGDDTTFERTFGRLQLVNSLALTGSALAGGALASIASPRWCYLATLPFAAAAIIAVLRFREPTLHRRGPARPTLRRQLAATYHAVHGRPRLIAAIAATAAGATVLQMLFEFGPLWLLAAGAPTLILGPYTAAMTSASGLGGVATALFGRPARTAAAAAALILGAILLATARTPLLAIAAQILLAVLLAAAGIHLSRVMHQAVPSTVRSAISSATGTLSWLTFLPASALFGWISDQSGATTAAWIPATLTITLAAALTMIRGRALDSQAA